MRPRFAGEARQVILAAMSSNIRPKWVIVVDPDIDNDCQFGVTKALLGNYVRHDSGTPPDPGVKAPWYTLDYTFTMDAGKATLPRAPIHDKAESMEARPEYLAAVQRAPSMAK